MSEFLMRNPPLSYTSFKNMVSLAIGIRERNPAIDPWFTLTIPCELVTEIAKDFPNYEINPVGSGVVIQGYQYIYFFPKAKVV